LSLLTLLVIAYSLYVLIDIYVSIMQIGYISQARSKKPVLMGSAAFIKAADYAIQTQRMGIYKSFVDYIIVLGWLGSGIALLDHVMPFQNELVKTIFMVLGFVFINTIISLPFSIYEKFVIDQKFGFNKATPGQYIKDTIVTALLSIVFGSLVIMGIYYIVDSFHLWWVYSFAFLFLVVIAMNMLFPTIRALFFDKLTPLQDESLKEKIQELMDRTGFQSSGVFVSDASKRDARLNAYFGGLGKSKRVVLFDTLLQKLTPKELLAVLGHELGHFAHGDIYKNIAVVGGLLFLMLALFGNMPDTLYYSIGVDAKPYAMMILFLILLPALSFFIMPIMGIISRKNEYAADETGAELGGVGGSIELANALQKLVVENKSFPLAHPLYIFFHYTHPPIIERLKALGVAIDDNKEAMQNACPTAS
jgi:STE24 endopeptidase